MEAILRAGGDPEEIFKKANLELNNYINPDRPLTVNQFANLCELCAKCLNDSFFGLHMGLFIGEQTAGPLSHLMSSSPTVEDVFKNIARYTVVLENGLISKYSQENGLPSLSASLATQENVPRRHANEAIYAQLLQFLKKGIGDHVVPEALFFEHEKPSDTAELDDYFRAPIYFNSPLNKAVFKPSILNEEMATANDTLYTVLKAHFEKLLADQPKPNDLVESVRRVITDNLSISETTVNSVASQLALSPRTLRRRLQEHHLTFHDIKKMVRQELAEQYLSNSQLGLSEIALLLGYSETSAFCRAFRDWVGDPPLVYRKKIIE